MNSLARKVAASLVNEDLLLDLAVGDYDDEAEVFSRHNVAPEVAAQLKESEVFQAAVLRFRSELEKDGRMTKYKARKMSDDVLERAYTEAMDDDTPLEKRLEALKVFMKIGDMEPRAGSRGSSEGGGPAFAIQINLPSLPRNAEPAEVVEIKQIEENDG